MAAGKRVERAGFGEVLPSACSSSAGSDLRGDGLSPSGRPDNGALQIPAQPHPLGPWRVGSSVGQPGLPGAQPTGRSGCEGALSRPYTCPAGACWSLCGQGQ